MKNCPGCELVKLIACIGALNWGLIALFNVNLVTALLGEATGIIKIVYIVVGVCGLLGIVSMLKTFPCCTPKDQCATPK